VSLCDFVPWGLNRYTILGFTDYEDVKIIYPVDLVDPVILSKIYHFTHTIRYRAIKIY